MRLPNHLAGGFCLTGFFASVFFSINVLASPVAIAAVIAGSILPDADNPKSLAGKLVYPIARWLNRKVGHRTLTHSMLFIGGLALLSSVVEKTFFGEIKISIILVIAWFVHVMLDTFTLQGVQLMFPFSFEPYWMFDKQEARMRNGDFRAEAGFFLAFAVLTFAQGNLWENGFWTSYNNQFGTIENLESEMRRSHDALLVTAFAKAGTVTTEQTGLLVELKSSGMVLMGSDGFAVVGDDEVFQHASFQHSGKQLSIQRQSIIGIGADSLNQILQGKHIASLEVAANQPFQITEPNGMAKQLSSFSANYLSQPPIFAEVAQSLTLDTFIDDRTYLAEIAQIEAEIQRTQRTQAEAMAAQRHHEAMLEDLHRQFSESTDIAQRQRIHEAIAELEKQKVPGTVGMKVEELRARIAKIRTENALRSAAKRSEIELRNAQELAKVQETRFTGMVRFVQVSRAHTENAPDL